jgi:hypothetical protein
MAIILTLLLMAIMLFMGCIFLYIVFTEPHDE